MDYIDNQKLIEDVKMIMKISDLRAALYHKVEEYKSRNAKRIEEYRELENMVDPEKKEKIGEPVKEIRFEIRKKKAEWIVNPVDIPQAVINHILAQDAKPGIIKMQKLKLHGKMIDLSFEMHKKDYFTGLIKEKRSEKETKQIIHPIIQARSAGNKTGDLKTLITYLLNNEILYNWMMREFFGNWKPLIDKGCIINER
jgi:hypothetical protein